MSAERWLLYALGGGLGHLTRAVALGRAARRRGHTVDVVTNSPFAPALALEAELGEGHVHRLGAELDKHAVRESIEQLLGHLRPEVLVVDTFPRGLGGELAPLLPGLRARKVLVHRDLHPDYVERFGLARFVDVFDRLILPGEPAPFAHHRLATSTPPWLVLDAHELLDDSTARRQLGVPPGDEASPVVAVLACGRREEVDECAGLAETLQRGLGPRALVRLLAPDAPPRLWPALAVMRGVDVLVGAGGYNTVQEARATGTPLVAIARPRLYDRQALRLRPSERLATFDEALGRVKALLQLESDTHRERPTPTYVNGAHEAVRLIERSAEPR
ncbi:hypothetical protein [Vitiosangium sp. GDMCC 1.1324]|uniref:hypothetical protein n=1 Tax=Vitiosangium sp. (strain GDMCC 1.1324) TaxID=2138576 RepID=UPI000D3AF4CB|nr:hypothetical protein [Vitiosangium sp. GDMCC 1.1324]PTL78916.1 hypothetical protein DAT35_35395 [Vitiosangium sp. GDMCC 1.1324]